MNSIGLDIIAKEVRHFLGRNQTVGVWWHRDADKVSLRIWNRGNTQPVEFPIRMLSVAEGANLSEAFDKVSAAYLEPAAMVLRQLPNGSDRAPSYRDQWDYYIVGPCG